MAQLKDLIVNGASRLIGDVFTNKIQITAISAPTASNGTTYGPGTSGQVLKSNGTSVYWAADDNSQAVTGVKGNSESSYRTGNVNITAANIGLGNVENTKLSTWTGSSNITTIGTLSSGTVPWARLTDVPTTISGYGITDAVTNISYDSSTYNITKTINGTTSNVYQMPCIAGTGSGSLIVGNLVNNIASGDFAFVAGTGAQATGTGSIAFVGGVATQTAAVAIGANVGNNATTASGIGSIAIGAAAVASNLYTVALGYKPNASGKGSIAIGAESSTSANYSLAFGGRGTKASSQYQTAMGKWNIEDNQDTYALILGNGTADDARSNALTVDWNGNLAIAGSLNWSSISSTPTTLAGYGITDANIASGVITLGNNTITPLTSSSTLNAAKLSGTIPSSCYTDTNDKVSQSATTTSSWRKVLLHHTADSSGADVTTTTDVVYAAKDVEVQPSTGTIKASAFQGNASSATYASNVRITATTPTSNTTYYLTFTSGTVAGTNYILRGNSMLKAWISANGGSVQLGIGDSSHNGSIYLYSSSGKYVNIVTSAMSSENRTLTIPDVTATIFTTAGGTCTGNISVSKSAPSINVYDTANNNISAQLLVGSGHQNHGLYSNGYAPTDSTFTSSSKWIIYRGSDGEAHSQLKIYGAVFNDYAEYRTTKNYIEPGRCIIETGNDDLILSTTRLQPGAEIVSDTFGFAIGQTKESNTPIASNGRVLAYIYEGREAAKNAIGKPVCSGPNGTVSIMTDEEYQKYGYCAIGTISSIPSYETWGTDNIKVNGRIWIRIK